MTSGRKFKLDKGTKGGLGVLAVITITIIVGGVLWSQTRMLGNVMAPYMHDPTDAELVCYGEKYKRKDRSIDALRNDWYIWGQPMGLIAHCPRSGGEVPPVLSDEDARRYLDGYADLKAAFKDDLVKAKEHYKVHGWKEGRIIPNTPISLWGKTIHLIGGQSGKLFCGVSAADKSLSCDRQMTTPREEFEVTKVSESQFALKNKSTNQYCRDFGDKIVCNSDAIGSHEKFDFVNKGKHRISFWGPKSGKDRKWCSDEGTRIICSRPGIDTWEIFKWSEAATLTEGNPVVCENDRSKIYRYTEGKLRHYPDSETATLWDPNYAHYKLVSAAVCEKIPIGPPMTKPGVIRPPPTEGAAVVCEKDTSFKVYRFTEGQLRHYPDEETGNLWDPNWRSYTTLTQDECKKYPIGLPMTKPGVQPSSSATSTTAVSGTTATIANLTDDEARRYLAAYPDLQKAFGNDLAAAKKHWIESGFKEGRTVPATASCTSASFSTMATTTTYDLTTPTTSATVTTPAVAFVTPVEGSSVTCQGGNGMVYRYTEGMLRYYPSPEIAAAWNPQWDRGIRVLSASECAGIPVSFPMEMPVKTNAATVTTPAVVFVTPVEGSSVTCQGRDGKVYRYTGGMLREYPSTQIAAAWNPQWATGVRLLSSAECAGLPLGSPMEMPVTTNAATVTTPASSSQSFAQNQFASSSTATAAQTSAASPSNEPVSETMAEEEDDSPKTVTQVQTGGNMTPFIVAAAVATALIFADHVM